MTVTISFFQAIDQTKVEVMVLNMSQSGMAKLSEHRVTSDGKISEFDSNLARGKGRYWPDVSSRNLKRV